MNITAVELDRRGSHIELRLMSDEGTSGSAFVERAPDARLLRLVDELLVGGDPRAIAHHWGRLDAANEHHERALSCEVAALDIALWDLRARSNGEPLWRTLGGLRPRANTHARLPADREHHSLRSWCDAIKLAGIRGVVIEASENHEADAATLVALENTLGDGMERAYMLDANERWYPKDAVRAISALERASDLTWIESPVHRSDFLGLKRVGDAVRGAVCSGGRLTSVADYLPHLKNRSLNIVQIDINKVGITGALQIADAAYAFELPVTLTASPGNLAAHIACVLPYCMSIELSTDTLRSGVRIENGWAVAGDAPGHGLAFEAATQGHA